VYKIRLERILPLLSGTLPKNGTQSLVRDILVLQGKLDRLSEQDFYFLKGAESFRRKLDGMKEQYALIAKMVNENTVDDLLSLKTEIEDKASQICSPKSNHPVFAKLLVRDVTTHEINLIQDAIQIKAKFGT